jgi:hypothetical protein
MCDDGSVVGKLYSGTTTNVVDFKITTVLTVEGTSVAGTRTGEGGNKIVGGKVTVNKAVGSTVVTTGVNVTTIGGGETGPVGTEVGINEVGIELGMIVVVTGLI